MRAVELVRAVRVSVCVSEKWSGENEGGNNKDQKGEAEVGVEKRRRWWWSGEGVETSLLSVRRIHHLADAIIRFSVSMIFVFGTVGREKGHTEKG